MLPIARRPQSRLSPEVYVGPGSFFVTLCARRRVPHFASIEGAVVRLSPAGTDVLSTWHELPSRFPSVRLDACVVMPDHVHAVVHLAPPQGDRRVHLTEIVQYWKCWTTRRINDRRGTPGAVVWKRSFFDHVVRDAADLRRIRRYIAENPARWSARYGARRGARS